VVKKVNFAGTDLTESWMCWNDFDDCDFSDADLSSCDMRASEFNRCKFVGAVLRGIELGDNTADRVGSRSGFERVSQREAFRQLVMSESESASVRREGNIEPDKSEPESSGGGISTGGSECESKSE
jgi:Pentapeptide repeats (8 copies)